LRRHLHEHSTIIGVTVDAYEARAREKLAPELWDLIAHGDVSRSVRESGRSRAGARGLRAYPLMGCCHLVEGEKVDSENAAVGPDHVREAAY
jgi:hypothetical protein